MKLTSQQLQEMGYAETEKGFSRVLKPDLGSDTPKIGYKAFTGPERELQDRIRDDLVARRWYVTGSRFGVKSTTDKGTPDIIAAGPNGLTLWIEVKKKGNKLTTDQNTVRHVLLALGHKYRCVYSFEEYEEYLKTITLTQLEARKE